MKKKTLSILLAITGTLFIGATALTLNGISKTPTTTVTSTPAANISSSNTNNYTKGINFIKCHINKIDYQFNYMEIQTFDFETIIINFLDNTLDGNNPKFNFKEGDWAVVLNAKSLNRNGSTFYFADGDTVIQKCDPNPITTIVTDRKAEEILDAEPIEKNAYYAFVCSKCAPSFDYFGFFVTAQILKERAKRIYEGIATF